MRVIPTAAAGHWWFKATLFALLGCNAAAYILSGTWSEAVDTTAWLVLLVLYELETDFGGRFREGRTVAAFRGARLLAAAAVCAAAIGYIRNEEWLDAINSGLWIAIVILLEVEVRHPGAVAAHRGRYLGAVAALYAGLVSMVLTWFWRGEWFEAYDALLWLAALAVIEMNILEGVRRKVDPVDARPAG